MLLERALTFLFVGGVVTAISLAPLGVLFSIIHFAFRTDRIIRWILLAIAEIFTILSPIILTWFWSLTCFSQCPNSLQWKILSLIVGIVVLLYFVIALAIPIRIFLRLTRKQFYFAITILYIVALSIIFIVGMEPGKFWTLDKSLFSKEAWRVELYGEKFIEQESIAQFKKQYPITYPAYLPVNVSHRAGNRKSSRDYLLMEHMCSRTSQHGILWISHTPIEKKITLQEGPQRAPNGNEIENIIIKTKVLGKDALFVETYEYRFYDSTRGRLDYVALYWKDSMQRSIVAEQCDLSKEELMKIAESMR